jgi:hypothetical protein
LVREGTVRRLAAIAAAVAMTGCDQKPQAVQQCEALLLPTLKAPSTYKLVEHLVSLPNKKTGKQDVFLTYDAANTYNAPIRGQFWCVFNPRNSSIEQGGGGLEGIADNLEAAADEEAKKLVAPPARPRRAKRAEPPPTPDYADGEEEEVPVCDRPDSAAKQALMNEIGVDCLPH